MNSVEDVIALARDSWNNGSRRLVFEGNDLILLIMVLGDVSQELAELRERVATQEHDDARGAARLPAVAGSLPAYVDLGVISFEQFREAIRNPPAMQVGFEIRPEDQQRYRQYMDSQPK